MNLAHARTFRDLVVYRKAKAITSDIFTLSKSFPREEMYSLTDQVRRASRSVGPQIAEAWAKRLYEKHFVSKLSDADAEQHETQHWVDTANDCGYLSDEDAARIISDLTEVGRMLNSMMDKSHLFCKSDANMVRETVAEYVVAGD